MVKVSLIVPSIRPDSWNRLFDEMMSSCQKYSFELIFVGPKAPADLHELPNLKFVRDYGSPSRCLQIGSLLAEGEYISWCSDDCQIEPNAFDQAIILFDEKLTDKDGMIMLYSEGQNFSGTQHQEKEYWVAHTHPDLRLPGVKEGWKIAPIFMYKTKTFYEFGGLDCHFEHVNMNTHDLAFAIQAKGGTIEYSPLRVFRFNWNPDSQRPDYAPILNSFVQNDRPRLAALYQNPHASQFREISLNNWKNQPSKWSRRFH
jgi:hypothetical protein